MSRLHPYDRWLIAGFVPLWLLCFALNLAWLRDGGPRASFYVSIPDADSYPTVTALGTLARVSESGLEVGDRLIRIGGTDLRGVGPFGLETPIALEVTDEGIVRVVFERGGETRQARVPVGYAGRHWPQLPASVLFAAAAVVLLARGAPSPVARKLAHTFVCVALVTTTFFSGSTAVRLLSESVHFSAFFLMGPLAVRAALAFPDGKSPSSRWGSLAPWGFAVLSPAQVGTWYALPWPWPGFAFSITWPLWIALLATLLALLTRAYRRSPPVGRRRIKWVVLGLYCALVPNIVSNALGWHDPRGFAFLHARAMAAYGLFPVAVLVAIYRFNLFDIDRVLSATASVNLLIVGLVAAGLLLVPRAAHAASGLFGVDPWAGQVLVSLALAGLVLPAHRRLRPRIDRLLFAERYAADQGIHSLLVEVDDCADPQALTTLVGDRLGQVLRPEACVVYAQGDGAYEPIFVQGRAVPSAFADESPLVATLRERQDPLALESEGRRGPDPTLGPFDRAALDTLDAAVLVPVLRGGDLLAFLCLGVKRSGDVYTSTDLALLARLADRVSLRLTRFQDDEIIRQGRAMQEALRRYVPGAVEIQLERGTFPIARECEVSVLFVDLRDYTAYAESRRPEEVFSTLNRYTETVSRLARDHGGSVVEFNGDGMMVVFGAPVELPRKEAAAVEAGREIADRVARLPSDGSDRLAVGIGIATGPALAGNIQAVDRAIWTAVGNTTNLAARLEDLTRRLDAWLVIDAATWRAAGAAGEGFVETRNVSIRGRSEPVDVYVLPRAASLDGGLSPHSS